MKSQHVLAATIGIVAVVCIPARVTAQAGAGDVNQVGSGGVIYACVSDEARVPRLVAANEACRRNETRLSWMQTGIAGPIGAQGLQGPAGPAGPVCP